MSPREIRGIAILAKGNNPISVKENEWFVPSQSSDKRYKDSTRCVEDSNQIRRPKNGLTVSDCFTTIFMKTLQLA